VTPGDRRGAKPAPKVSVCQCGASDP
jgi:hypothetical protein